MLIESKDSCLAPERDEIFWSKTLTFVATMPQNMVVSCESCNIVVCKAAVCHVLHTSISISHHISEHQNIILSVCHTSKVRGTMLQGARHCHGQLRRGVDGCRPSTPTLGHQVGDVSLTTDGPLVRLKARKMSVLLASLRF